MVSQSASSDDLTNALHFFFRVIPPNAVQARVAANFALKKLNAKNAVVFFDPSDTYSRTIAKDFEDDFINNGGMILPDKDNHSYDGKTPVGMHFTVGKMDKDTFVQLIQQTLRPTVDMFYFTGVNPNDAISFQNALPSAEKYKNLRVIAGDGSYVSEPNSHGRWYLTSYAYHDEISIITNNHGNDDFLVNYAKNFDDHKEPGTYGFNLPDATAILTYDAANTLIQAINALSLPITSQKIADKLPSVAFQGVSGYIALDNSGNPRSKTILILSVDKNGLFKMVCAGGGAFYGNDNLPSNLICPS